MRTKKPQKRRYHASLVTEYTNTYKKRRYHASMVSKPLPEHGKRRYHASLVSKYSTEHEKRRYHASLKIKRIGKIQTNLPLVNVMIAKNHKMDAQMTILTYYGKLIIIIDLFKLKCNFNGVI